MRLRDPLTSILDRPTKVKVLRVLVSPGLELTGRQIAAEAKVNHAGCNRALKELVDIGVVDMRRRGRANLYTLRHENILVARGFVPLFKAERDLFDEAVSYLRRRFERQAVSAVLFGSYARGEGDHRSDLDVLFLVGGGSDAARLERDLLKTASEFYWRFAVTLTPYVKTIARFVRMLAMRAPLAQEIMKEGKDLFGQPMREVLASGAHKAG